MPETPSLPERIDALLPQTQCTGCGFAGCLPYAEAIARGEAPINRCAPGGAAGIAALAALLGTPPLPLDPAHGTEEALRVARIDEAVCIGCTRCITACPVDAIIGGPKRMHTVIESLCSGCTLCLPACPVDCIELVASPAHAVWSRADADAARVRLHARRARLARQATEHDLRMERVALGKLARLDDEPADDLVARKRTIVQGALERARARLRERAAAPGDPATHDSSHAGETP